MKATYGGEGFEPRTTTHAEELGGAWLKCGARSSVQRLRHVLLARPPQSLGEIDDAEGWLMERVPDLEATRAASLRLAAAWEALDVEVSWIDTEGAPPNVIFAADLFFMSAEGAILGRLAGRARAGEERFAAAALAGLGVPILATPTGGATFEGADALWLGKDRVLLGVGLRTNQAGAALVEEILARQGVEVQQVELPKRGAQHLLGICTPLADDLVLLRPAMASASLREALSGVEVIELDEDDPEVAIARGNNLVALAPTEVLMPTGAPRLRERMESFGVVTHTVDVRPYLDAAGAIGCATGILRRG
ncbi:MAG TPA: arginine deiminase family protein [Myxococcota bacterium]|nr:arginine deiminase family protein [Myxococcota bacterium]